MSQDTIMLLPTDTVTLLITQIIIQLVMVLITQNLFIHATLIHHVILEAYQSTARKVSIVITAVAIVMESAMTDISM